MVRGMLLRSEELLSYLLRAEGGPWRRPPPGGLEEGEADWRVIRHRWVLTALEVGAHLGVLFALDHGLGAPFSRLGRPALRARRQMESW